jgi:GDPmannose 4,6-dehydratase/GDP-4-dehydro-6-deoxy-D-mannose reductase
MKVLVTGVSGFVGSYLAEYLQDKAEVHGIKRWRSPLENISHLTLKLHDCDLTDLSAVISVLKEVKPEIIYHLAAQSYVPFSYSNPNATLQTNVIGTSNLLEAVRLSGQNPLIHVCSSSEVYGQPEYTPIDEKHPLNPISPYGVSK